MKRKITATAISLLLAFSITGCGNTADTTKSNSAEPTAMTDAAAQEQSISNAPIAETALTSQEPPTTEIVLATEAALTSQEESADTTSDPAENAENALQAVSCTVNNHLAEDTDALVNTYVGRFMQESYMDEATGLSITYNLYLPENYDSSNAYPMVVFIGDSSCTGYDATVSLTQGRGGLVWATEEWQSQNPTIVAVPTYPETILDDHGSYTQTEYVELTKRFIDFMSSEYAVDTNRIYGTGQSMGCMTTLILASEYPDLYAACMFVDGQWDITALGGLENQTFVYFAAEDDANAWNGSQEVMSMFSQDSVSYEYAQWDGTWSVDELSVAAASLFSADENQYFISWASGTIEPKSGNMGMGGFGSGNGPSHSDFEGPDKGNLGMNGPSDGEFPGKNGEMDEHMEGSMNSSAYHMASFDYAYNCVAVMEWLFEQHK